MTTINLQDQLDEITANTRHLVQAERLAVGERAVEELFASGIEDRILPVGAHGAGVRPQRRHWQAGSQRGHARPGAADRQVFSRTLVPLLRHRTSKPGATSTARSASAAALMVAIGPQTERQSDFMAGQHGLPFPVLSDSGCALAEKFGLVYTIPEYHRDYYLSILVNIPFVNGEPGWRLPLPATYVINPAGRVVFAEAHADFRVRPEPEEALAAAFAHHGR